MSATTWLGLEPLIIARLVEYLATVPALAPCRVLSIADVSGAKEAALPKPSLRVLYWGHQVQSDPRIPAGAGFARVEQTWLVVAAARNVAGIAGGAPARAEVSPFVDAAWDALNGWVPPGNHYSPLAPATPPVSPATLDGCTYVPLAYTTRFRRSLQCPE